MLDQIRTKIFLNFWFAHGLKKYQSKVISVAFLLPLSLLKIESWYQGLSFSSILNFFVYLSFFSAVAKCITLTRVLHLRSLFFPFFPYFSYFFPFFPFFLIFPIFPKIPRFPSFLRLFPTFPIDWTNGKRVGNPSPRVTDRDIHCRPLKYGWVNNEEWE